MAQPKKQKEATQKGKSKADATDTQPFPIQLEPVLVWSFVANDGNGELSFKAVRSLAINDIRRLW